MADNQMHSDAEYHPQEEEYPNLANSVAVTAPKITGRLKRLFVAVVAIVVVVLAYNFFNWYSGQNRSSDNKQPVANINVNSALPVTNENLSGLGVIKSDANDAVHKQLDVLSQEVESNREQLAELSNSLMQGQQSIDKLNKNIANLVTAVQDMGKDLQKVPVKENPKAVVKEKSKSKAKKSLPIYHIRAIVPERAWLESDTGETISVRVGDNLEGYGEVQAISPKQGLVVTKSQVIQYGNNDI